MSTDETTVPTEIQPEDPPFTPSTVICVLEVEIQASGQIRVETMGATPELMWMSAEFLRAQANAIFSRNQAARMMAEAQAQAEVAALRRSLEI